MRISAIAALSEKNRAIGKDKQLLWHLPGDLPRFKALTTGHPLIMGRGTYEHILLTTGKPFKDRTNIVVSRSSDLKMEQGFVRFDSFEEAVAHAEECPGGDDEIFVIGGGILWQEKLPSIQRLHLTIVRDEPEADAYFPDYSEFKKVIQKSEIMKSGELSYYYLTLER